MAGVAKWTCQLFCGVGSVIDILKIHQTFATAGSDGAFNFWDKDSKQRLKAMARCNQPIPCSTFNNDGSIFAYAFICEYDGYANGTYGVNVYCVSPPSFSSLDRGQWRALSLPASLANK
ncbi:hypothetical protein AMTR_s00032p00043780 [Amborella trichopoda]|uniref:Uncharacterized protein n=1 Tax=Amborella trichopoda TaxID=13333 RepID=U5CXS8_AMBTC|nr:hypothetical protein AMTR_s00032p00043780 [Amborella trichopoda]